MDRPRRRYIYARNTAAHDTTELKTSNFKNKEKVLAKAMRYASTTMLKARRRIEDLHCDKWKELLALELDENLEFSNMIHEFLPEYEHLLPK